MINDARSLPDGQRLEGEVCIIGAGAAGITLAMELDGQPFRVLVLESGGLEFDGATQELYAGASVGHPSHPLDSSRLRYFGGTTNHWNGACRPLDAMDFEKRDWLPETGWPFSRDTLMPFYLRAQEYCQLGPFVYDVDAFAGPARPLLPLEGARLLQHHFQSSPTRFGEVYRERLQRSANVHVWLHANVTSIETARTARAVSHLELACLEGTRHTAVARLYVLATGGLENPRILLLSNRTEPAGLGNRHGLVGRYFSDHVVVGRSAVVLFGAPHPALATFSYQEVDGVRTRRCLVVSPATQGAERLVNCGLSLWPLQRWPDLPGIASYRSITEPLARGEFPDDLLAHLRRMIAEFDTVYDAVAQRLFDTPVHVSDFWSECPPLADSRVSLGDDRDALGQRRIRLDWRVPGEVARAFERLHAILAEELGRSGLGRIRLVVSGDEAVAGARSAYHHLGTTRMHADARHGVVDPDCRVHGIANLFVAGSSVFPAYGYANPTLTIVALAIRLADHLKARHA